MKQNNLLDWCLEEYGTNKSRTFDLTYKTPLDK